MFQELLSYHRRSVTRFFAKNRGAKLLTTSGFVLALGFFALIVYAFFYNGFSYVARDEYFREVLTLYIVELFLLVSFVLVLLSALISGVFTLFRPESDSALIASPRFALRVRLSVVRAFATSLWPLLVIVLPAFLAMKAVFGFPLLGLFAALCSVTILIALSSILAVDVLLLIGTLLERSRAFSVRLVASGSFLVFLAAAAYAWEQFRSVNLINMFQARVLENASASLVPVIEQFQYFPSHLAALTVLLGQKGDTIGIVAAMLALFLLAVLASILLLFLERTYLPQWQRAQEHRSIGLTKNPMFMGRHVLARSMGAKDAILRKETIAFLRDTRGLLWIGFILFIWVIQVASSHLLVSGLAEERVALTDAPGIIGMLQFASVMYFIAMFVLRFAFPSFSAEKKTAWVLASAPVDLREVFRAKLLFFTSTFVIIACIFAFVNAQAVGLALAFELPVLVAVVLGTAFLTVLGLSLGALYPNRETDDPERLSTTMPGIGFIFSALLYGGAGAWIIERSFSGDAALLIGFIAMTIVGAIILLWATLRALPRVALQ